MTHQFLGFQVQMNSYSKNWNTPYCPDCHSWWISKMQSDTLEERYAIKFCFKLGKNATAENMECFRLLFNHFAWIEHQFLSGIRDSRKARSLWGMMRGVGGINSSPLRSYLLQLQCICCTIPTTSGRPHGSPLVWACQWPSTQPLSSLQLSHNNSLWA